MNTQDHLTAFGRFTVRHPTLGIIIIAALLPVYLTAGALDGTREGFAAWLDELADIRVKPAPPAEDETDLLLMTQADEEWAEQQGLRRRK